MKRWLWHGLGALALVHCIGCGGRSSSDEGGQPSSQRARDGEGEEALGGVRPPEPGSLAAKDPRVQLSIIHDEHRAIPGAMFGGWGPHLGHLLRRRSASASGSREPATDETWFVDDACARTGAGACNVNSNPRVNLLRLEAGTWKKVDALSIPSGVQQNTGALLSGDRIFVYGVDVARNRVVECSKDLVSGAKGCVDLPGTTPRGSNYVGAALSPRGFRMTWYTTVVDAGGGSFSYLVDYGSGWNGPRSGPVGGFNDASYVNVAFGSGTDADRFTMHGQLVSGMAPAWSFVGSHGAGSLAGANAVVWTTPFTAPPDATVASTNDIAIDPLNGDTHLVARTSKGDSAYYFAPKGKPFEGPLHVFKGSFRARLSFVETPGGTTLALTRGVQDRGLSITLAGPEARAAGPVKWGDLPEIVPTLPAGYENLVAIYPVSSVYQSAPVTAVEVALVGKLEHQVLYVRLDP